MNKVSIPKLHSIKWKTGPLAENVTHIGPDGKKDVPAMSVLQGAAEAMLYDLVLIGYDQDGQEYIAGTMANQQRAAYMFARGHLHMLRDAD